MSLIQATAPNLLSVSGGGATAPRTMQVGILAAPVGLASGTTAIYTVAAKTSAVIDTVSICNKTTSAVILTVTVTPSGGSATTLVSSYSLGANDAATAEDVLSGLRGLKLGPGDAISVNTATASALDILITGSEAVTP